MRVKASELKPGMIIQARTLERLEVITVEPHDKMVRIQLRGGFLSVTPDANFNVVPPLQLGVAMHNHDHGVDGYLFLYEQGVVLEDDDAALADILNIDFNTDEHEVLAVSPVLNYPVPLNSQLPVYRLTTVDALKNGS